MIKQDYFVTHYLDFIQQSTNYVNKGWGIEPLPPLGLNSTTLHLHLVSLDHNTITYS